MTDLDLVFGGAMSHLALGLALAVAAASLIGLAINLWREGRL